MAYTVRSILGKIRLHRSDLREAELDYITQETVRKICRLTMLAQKTVVLPFVGPTAQLALTDSAGEDVNRIHLVRWQDSFISKPDAPTVTATSGTGFANSTRHNYCVAAKSGQGWVSRHSDLATVTTSGGTNYVSGTNQVTVTMPSIPSAPNGFDHFDLYRIDTLVSSDKTVTGITIASEAVVSSTAHGYAVDDNVTLFNVAGMTQINGKLLTITAVSANTFTVDLDTTDSSKYSIWTSGGIAVRTPADQFRLCNTGFSNINQGNISTGIDTNNTYSGVNGSNVNYVNFETSVSTIPTYATGDYKTMSEANEVFMNDTLPKPDSSFGDPMVWAFDALTSTINLYPPASNAYANGGNLEVTYSYIPRGEIDTVPLPPEAEDGIIYGTLAEAYIFTGPSQNIQLGKMYETKFNNETSNLKSVAIQGNSGRMAIPANPLGGRRKKPFGAFGSSSGWGW